MLTYCFECKKNNNKKKPKKKPTKNVDSKVLKTKNGKTILVSKCAVCNSKQSRFMKGQEAKWILSSLGPKTPLRRITLLGDILFLN